MVADPVIFRDLAYVFVAAVLGAILARLARQPLILGYVLAGVLICLFSTEHIIATLRNSEVEPSWH